MANVRMSWSTGVLPDSRQYPQQQAEQDGDSGGRERQLERGGQPLGQVLAHGLTGPPAIAHVALRQLRDVVENCTGSGLSSPISFSIAARSSGLA